MKISLKNAIDKILASPNVADRKPIFEKYDQNVQGNTVAERKNYAANIIAPFRDFAELDEKSAKISVGIATGGNPNIAKISAKAAAQSAICEAVLKLSCVGSEPIGITDCLNFGNPEKPEQMGEFVDAINGLKEVCNDLNLPIVSGNVSFYNESSGRSIPPSALISVFGKVADPTKIVSTEFKKEGDKIFLVGINGDQDLGGTEFMRIFEKNDSRIPQINFVEFREMAKKLRTSVTDGLLSSANPVLAGGQIVAILKSCFLSDLGANINIPAKTAVPNFLFAENLVAVVSAPNSEQVQSFFGDNCYEIGEVTEKSNLTVKHGEEEILNENISELKTIWENSLRDIF